MDPTTTDLIKKAELEAWTFSAVSQETARQLIDALKTAHGGLQGLAALRIAEADAFKCDMAREERARLEADGSLASEEFGFAMEMATQYGANYLDDDAKLLGIGEEDLYTMMKVLGYCRTPTVAPANAVDAARSTYGSDDLQIDDGARLAACEDGSAWVQAWVWLPAPVGEFALPWFSDGQGPTAEEAPDAVR